MWRSSISTSNVSARETVAGQHKLGRGCFKAMLFKTNLSLDRANIPRVMYKLMEYLCTVVPIPEGLIGTFRTSENRPMASPGRCEACMQWGWLNAKGVHGCMHGIYSGFGKRNNLWQGTWCNLHIMSLIIDGIDARAVCQWFQLFQLMLYQMGCGVWGCKHGTDLSMNLTQ